MNRLRVEIGSIEVETAGPVQGGSGALARDIRERIAGALAADAPGLVSSGGAGSRASAPDQRLIEALITKAVLGALEGRT